MVISNVPGPDFPLYLAGTVVEQLVPLGPLILEGGIEHHLFQLPGWVDFGFVTTPEIAGDIDDLANAIEPALKELEAPRRARTGSQPAEDSAGEMTARGLGGVKSPLPRGERPDAWRSPAHQKCGQRPLANHAVALLAV